MDVDSSKGTVLLNAVLVAAPTDLATWYIGQWVGSSRSSDCARYQKETIH